MTHSGGKPHEVGDRGQRYEVTFYNPATGERQGYGWAASEGAANVMRDSVNKHPSWRYPRIKDRMSALGALVNMRLDLTTVEKELESANKAIDALAELVYLKSLKDQLGKVKSYTKHQPEAWKCAKAVLREIGDG